MPETWPTTISSSKHIAEALDWVRHKSGDRVRVAVAIGVNSIAIAKPREVDPEDAIAILADLQDQIARAIRELGRIRQTHLSVRLRER